MYSVSCERVVGGKPKGRLADKAKRPLSRWQIAKQLGRRQSADGKRNFLLYYQLIFDAIDAWLKT